MAKKKNKAEKPEKEKQIAHIDEEAVDAIRADSVEQRIKAIIEKGKKKG